MSADLYRCGTCGASLSLEQLRGTDCPFCKQAFPHHARAVEQAALVNQVMNQQMNAQNPWMQPPPAGYGAPQQYGVTPPQYGAPPNYGAQNYGNPYGAYGAQVNAQVNQALKRSMIGVFLTVGLIFVMGIAGAVMFLVMR